MSQEKLSVRQDDKVRELNETLLWRENKIKALEAQRDYFRKLAQSQIPLAQQNGSRRNSTQVKYEREKTQNSLDIFSICYLFLLIQK